jgi:transposase
MGFQGHGHAGRSAALLQASVLSWVVSGCGLLARCRRALRRRGITPRIARRGIESSQRLGRHRYVVERSLAWLVGYRRLQVRYERRADILLGFVHLACALICLEL